MNIAIYVEKRVFVVIGQEQRSILQQRQFCCLNFRLSSNGRSNVNEAASA